MARDPTTAKDASTAISICQSFAEYKESLIPPHPVSAILPTVGKNRPSTENDISVFSGEKSESLRRESQKFSYRRRPRWWTSCDI
jgi:hypothetical protein